MAAVWDMLGVGWCGWAGVGAEAVNGGLVAGVWREMVSCAVSAFGVCGWDRVVICVNWWLLADCCRVVVAVASVVISDGGGSGVSVGRLWCGWETCWSVGLGRGVPYFPV